MNFLMRLLGIASLLVLSGACSQAGNEPASTPAAGARAEPNVSQTPADGHSSRGSVGWAGAYSGIIPCADCPGIRTTVTLHGDGRFERTRFYLERGAPPQAEAGQFAWNAAGSAITLQEPDGGGQQYKVGENVLFHLDRDGNPITGDLARRYVLRKHLRDAEIEGVTWTLIELEGRPLDGGAPGGRPSLLLDSARSTASGSASCNTFSGAYAITIGNRISFGPNLAVTMMACPDMSTEDEFLAMLRSVDNYAVTDGVLSLNRARMAPRAKFSVVYGQGESL